MEKVRHATQPRCDIRRTFARRSSAEDEVRTMLVWRAGVDRYASPIDEVRAVIRATAIFRAPMAGPVLGYFDYRGTTVPVIDPRRALRSSAALERPIRTTDRFVLLELGTRTVALLVDEVEGLREIVTEAAFDTAPEVLLGRALGDAFPLLTVFDVSELPPAARTRAPKKGARA